MTVCLQFGRRSVAGTIRTRIILPGGSKGPIPHNPTQNEVEYDHRSTAPHPKTSQTILIANHLQFRSYRYRLQVSRAIRPSGHSTRTSGTGLRRRVGVVLCLRIRDLWTWGNVFIMRIGRRWILLKLSSRSMVLCSALMEEVKYYTFFWLTLPRRQTRNSHSSRWWSESQMNPILYLSKAYFSIDLDVHHLSFILLLPMFNRWPCLKDSRLRLYSLRGRLCSPL